MRELLVNIDVPDLASAEAFYTSVLQVHVGRRFGPGAVELIGGTAKLYLLVKPAGTPSSPAGGARDYARHWTPVRLDVVVDRLEESIARALAAGAKPEGEIVESSWCRMQVFSDPFGHGMCFLELNERGYDAISTE